MVHRLFSSALSEEKNVQCYGRAAMSLHGHKLDFEIKFSGPVVRATCVPSLSLRPNRRSSAPFALSGFTVVRSSAQVLSTTS